MKKVVLSFGLIAGVMMSVVMLVTVPFADQIGFDKGAIIGYTTMVLAFLMVYFGIRSYRDNVAGGSVTFGRAFVVGLLITLVASACYVATWQVVYYKLMPDSGQKYVAYELAKANIALALGKDYRQDQALDWGFLTVPEEPHRGRRKPT